MTAYTWIDYLIFFIFFLNVITGLARGLLREIISIMSLIVALAVAIKFTLPITEFLNSTNGFKDVVLAFSTFTNINAIGPLSYISLGLSFLVLFVGTYCIGEAVNYYVQTFGVLLFPTMAFLDRILGACLGFVRGYVFVLIFILIVGMTPVVSDDGWTRSYFVSALTPSANKLGNMVRPGGFPVWQGLPTGGSTSP